MFFLSLFPVDVVEIGERHAKIGDILKVKALAAFAMIDEGELDWKIVAISLGDPRASLVNDVMMSRSISRYDSCPPLLFLLFHVLL